MSKYKSTTELLVEIDKRLLDSTNNSPRLGSWEGSLDSYVASIAHYHREETERRLEEIKYMRFIG